MLPAWLSAASQALGFALPRLVGGVGLTALLTWLLPKYRAWVLLALSLAFFGLFTGWIPLACQAAAAGLGFALWRWAEVRTRRAQRAVLALVLSGNALAYFGLMNASRLGLEAKLPTVQALGLSYLFWRVLHVAVDAYQGKLQRVSLPRFLLYLFYFPTMKGGPIQRYQDFFAAPFFQAEGWRLTLTAPQLLRFAGGLAKLLACRLSLQIDYDALWPQTGTLAYLVLLKILYARAISFYLIASGANDLTLMVSKALGIPLPENYDYPYFQRNLAHFWRRWHMTLTACLRDYVYEPLGGKRKHQYRNYLITFLVCAFWHVCSPAFLFWGLWHGLGLCLLRAWQDFWEIRVPALGPGGEGLRRIRAAMRAQPSLGKALSGLLTFHFVALGWLPFWGGHPQGTTALLRLVGLGFLLK
ncbi:MAG: MBOAT family O-acyltransferase [bacterium]